MLTTLALALLPFGAQAQNSSVTEISDRYDSLIAGADEYYFYEDNRKQVVDYKTDRVIRLCLGTSNHTIPLNITADDRELTLQAGDCIRIEAQQVWLQPGRRLPDLAMLKVDVETLNM
ncbi:MAG: hypothetical protein ACE37N_10740 [Pseudohongiellaceae bacterium]|jgi:hypothetical protein